MIEKLLQKLAGSARSIELGIIVNVFSYLKYNHNLYKYWWKQKSKLRKENENGSFCKRYKALSAKLKIENTL